MIFVQTSFHKADNVVDQLVIGPSRSSPQGYKYRHSDVIAFADGLFGILYAHSTGAGYYAYVKNGKKKQLS